MNILRQLADEAEVRVENKRKEVSDEEIRHQALLKSLERRREGRGWNFEKTLAGSPALRIGTVISEPALSIQIADQTLISVKLADLLQAWSPADHSSATSK